MKITRNQLPDPEALNVVVVDDDPIFRTVAASKLAKFRYRVSEAGDGTVAWAAIRQDGADLALVDLEMPNMGGIELIRCIRSHPATRHMPVVVITSRNDTDAVRASLQAGATSFMTKPVNWSMFENHIDFLLRLHSAAETGRRAETNLQNSRQTLSELTDVLTSDIMSRLATVIGTARQAQDDPASNGSHGALETILRETALAEHILRSLVDAVREEAGQSFPAAIAS